MNKILLDQLQKLATAHFDVDGKSGKDFNFSKPFSEILFYRKNNDNNEVKIIFEDYIINPFNGFDFHEKWNNNIPPYSKTMYGKIEKETKGMYYFKGHSETDDKIWEGWVPKKSCIIK